MHQGFQAAAALLRGNEDIIAVMLQDRDGRLGDLRLDMVGVQIDEIDDDRFHPVRPRVQPRLSPAP